MSVVPMLTYGDGPAAMDWLTEAFGFVEQARWLDDDGRVAHGVAAGAPTLSEIEDGGPGRLHHTEDIEGIRWMFLEGSGTPLGG